MKGKSIIKLLTVLAVLLISFSLVVSSIAVVEGINHNCTGEDCQVCLYINSCRNIFKALLFTLLQAVFLNVLILKIRLFSESLFSLKISNPVFMKVKLSN